MLTLLYCGIFVLLASVQFPNRGEFTRRAGDIVVFGQHRLPGEDEAPLAPNEYLLNGAVHLSFGGIEFGIFNRNGGDSFILAAGDRFIETLPERLFVFEDSVNLIFPGGAALEFYSQYTGDFPEMRVIGVFPDNVTSISLPFRPMRRTREGGGDQLIFTAGGRNYSFGHSAIDLERMMLMVGTGGAVYRAIPDGRIFSPIDYILPEAQTAGAYNQALQQWRNENYSLWSRTISTQNNEDVIIAFAAEALARGNYRAAIASVSPAFLRSSSRTHQSSVYLGGLTGASLSLIAEENEKLSRIAEQLNGRSLDFLKETRILDFLAIRGQNNLFDAGAAMIRSIDPNIISLDIVPGILEGYIDWMALRPNSENPFEHLIEQAHLVISESLLRNSGRDRVFVHHGNQRDIDFNLRLGKAILNYAESVQNEAWTGIGRSFILSALSYAWETDLQINSMPADESSASGGADGARLLRILSLVDNHPRSVSVSTMPDNVWVWTAATAVSSVYQNDTLHIAVDFPAGQSHYMIIRGIRPFSRIQLYNIDFRTDPQFEIYDSSGWSYIPQTQTLIVKMAHRSQLEHIRIIYREPPRPVVTEPEPETDTDQGETIDS